MEKVMIAIIFTRDGGNRAAKQYDMPPIARKDRISGQIKHE